MAVLAERRQEWHRFKGDRPGQRFRNHQRRTRQKSQALFVTRVVLGLSLVVAGLVMRFLPGPGILALVFGVALLVGLSERIAATLDRSEPHARDMAAWLRREWLHRSTGRAWIAWIGFVVLAAIAYGVWRWLT